MVLSYSTYVEVNVVKSGMLVNHLESHLMWNSIISTQEEIYMCVDITNIPLQTPGYIYVYDNAHQPRTKNMDLYYLSHQVIKRYVYMKIQKGIHGLLHT